MEHPLQMSEIVGRGIVKALPVRLQAALAFHRHIGEHTRERGGLLAKALNQEIALRSFRFCYQLGIKPGPDSFTAGTTHDVPTSTRIRVSGLFNLEFADRSSAHPLQRSTERESARGKTGFLGSSRLVKLFIQSFGASCANNLSNRGSFRRGSQSGSNLSSP